MDGYDICPSFLYRNNEGKRKYLKELLESSLQ